jgi:predicted transcriptional regulator
MYPIGERMTRLARAYLTAREVMTEGIVWCRDIDEVDRAPEVMQKSQVRRLTVIDQNKRMSAS